MKALFAWHGWHNDCNRLERGAMRNRYNALEAKRHKAIDTVITVNGFVVSHHRRGTSWPGVGVIEARLVPDQTFFEAIKGYVEFDDQSSAYLNQFHALASGEFPGIIDDFYATIQRHPGASAAITGGQPQIARLKRTLVRWMHELFLGPHDEDYFAKHARIGHVHVQIGLPQSYMLTAMNRIRVRMVKVASARLAADQARLIATSRAMHQIMDLELAIMLETYREDLLIKNRTAERLSTIGQFAAGIGHELRNPLGVIESSAYLLRQYLAKDPTDARIGKHLDRITAEVQRSAKTITELLELARNRPPRRQAVGVRWLVAAAISATPLPDGVKVVSETQPDDEVMLNVDRDQVVRVLSNLFVNASQAMNGNGLIRVDATRSNGATILRVRDDGPGIPTTTRPRIFEALFTTKAKGTGLGLALCQRIVEAHGGTIVLESAVADQVGAGFLISIPDVDQLVQPT